MGNFLMYFLFVLGIIFIVKGGDWFVDGAVWAAEVTGIPKFIVGATVVSIATTLPEIIVSTIAAVDGHKILVSRVGDYIAASQDKVGMAIGNGIGSVICNTAMKHYLFTDTDRKKKLCPEGYPAFSRRNRAVFVFLKRFFIAHRRVCLNFSVCGIYLRKYTFGKKRRYPKRQRTAGG